MIDDKTILMKDLVVDFVNSLEIRLNTTSEQKLLAMRGAFVEMEKKAEEEDRRIKNLERSLEAIRRIA